MLRQKNIKTANPRRFMRGKWYAAHTVVWWLALRILYGLDLSRLAIFRRLPGFNVQRVSPAQNRWGSSYWLFNGNKMHCLTYEKKYERITIRELPLISRN